MSSDNNFANKAIDKFLLNKDTSLSISLSSIKADDSKSKEESGNKKIEQEKESKAESAYEDYLENWKQGDPIPFIPPGKEFILCRIHLDPLTADREAGYHDIPELTKKPYKKSSPEEQLIEFKNLGPKLSASLTSILGRVAKSRGLWIDDKNKLRCPPGSPAANQFTDITGSNCFIPSPETAAGSARRAVRRAVNGADILSSPTGGRTDTSFAGTEQRVQTYTTDDFATVHAAMGISGRIGMPGPVRGPVWDRGAAVRGAREGKKSWQLGAKEQRERGKILTTQADVLHRRFMGQSAPVGLTRASRRTVAAMDRQIASPSNYLLPSGNPVGDILNKGNFMRAMKELFPNVDPNELEKIFDSSIPAGLTLKERVEAQLVSRTIFEGMIFEAIQNPQHFKWVTQFNVGQVKGDPTAAWSVEVNPFAPSPLSGGRRAGVGVTTFARGSTQVGETGGMHVSMTYNPLASYLYARGAGRTKFSDGSGEFDSIQGKALYLATHESGHMVDFGEKLKALGLDPDTLSRLGRTTSLVSTPSGPARQPNFYSGGWDIDWSRVTNPTGNASVQEMMDAAAALQTNSYTGGRFGGRKIDMMDDLNKFHLGFSDAFINNINTTPEDHELMAQFAGGDYAASLPQEARAEFYAARRLFGESTKFPSTVYPGGGPIKVADKNLVEKFAETEAKRRAIQEVDAGLITVAAQPARELVLQGEVLNELRNAGRNTFGIPTGGWNVSGLMSTPERNGRVSLHARRVQDLVAATDIQTQRARRGTNIPTGVSGKMSTPEIRKPSRPREPDNGPYTGRFLEIFSGVKDFADFRDRYRKEDIIYFDYETTGFGADGNMPVQIGAVRMRGGQVVERFNVFVNPGIPLGEWAQKNLKDGSGNPLTDTWLAQQESLKDAHEKLIEFFGEDALIGGQYTPFDLEVFDRVTKDLGISYKPGGVIDSKALADETLPRWTPDKPDGPTMVDPKTGDKKGSSSLGPLAEYLGVDLGDGWHTADADAEASALVTERMLDRAVANPDVTPRTILDPDEMPNIVERRRKKYATDMEQYERDKIDYEAGVSGKMSVPQFETANGSTYERQPDGRYKRRKAAEAAGKPVDVVETTYDNTVFLTPDAKQAVQLAADRGRHLNSNGDLMGLSYDDRNLNTPQLLKLRRDGAEFDEAFEKSGGVISYFSINRSEIRESPQVGLHPFEWDTDGKKTHTGSPVSAVTRRPGNDVDQTPSASSGVSGKMTLAQAETRKSIVDDKLERYKKAVKEYDETGEWKGAEYGVVTALPSERDAALHLDNPEITPKNMNMLQFATEDADAKGLTGAEKEKFIADELKKRRADMDRKIQFLEREQKLAESLIESKRVRSEQNVLDIEDISPEEIEKLKAESAEIRRLKESNKPEERELFFAMMGDGETRYMTHAGESELKGGVLQGSASIGAEASYSGGITRGVSGDTRGLNNEVVADMKGRVLSWGKSISILDKAIKEAEESGTFTYLDSNAQFAFRGFSGFDRTLMQSDYGKVFNIADDIGYTKERWIESLKSQRNVFAKDLEIEQNILSRIEKDDYQFLSGELAERFAGAGMGYYGRYSHRRIPAEISKNVGSDTDIAAGMGLDKPEINDPQMTQRWLDSLRGTIWIAKGKSNVEFTNLLGPSSEVQILGKTKPIVGFSSTKNTKYDLAEILPALLVRAINEDRKNGGTIRPLVLAGRMDPGSGVSGKMTSEQRTAASKEFTKDIFGKLKDLKERLGYGTDFEEKVSKEKLDETIKSAVDQAQRDIDYYFGRDIVIPQRAIDYIHKIATTDKFFGSDDIGGAEGLWPIQVALMESSPGVWPKGDPLPPSLALEISRQIHIARGNTEMVAKIDEFKNYLKTATPEQLSEDMRAASLAYGQSIEKRVLVRTKSKNIQSFIKGNRTILTQHDQAERDATGIESTNRMGDSITTGGRRKVEGNILGLPFQEGVADSPEVRELRPTSGYVTTSKTAAARKAKFKEIYGDDVELMYDGPAGEALEASQNGTWKYGDAHFVLRPEVAERTRVFDADTVDLSMKDNAPLQLSSLGEDGIFLGGARSPIPMLYDYKTGDTYPTPSGAFERSSDTHASGSMAASYKEALVLGRFKPEEVQAIIATPADFRKESGEVDGGRNANNERNVSLLIDMAQGRDELMREHGIEVIPKIGYGIFRTDDVEMFNPAMTDVWFEKNFGDKGLSKEEIIPDKSTTPYEAYLRVLIASGEAPEFMEYRGPSGATIDEKKSSQLKTLEFELERAIKARNSQGSGVSGKMSALTPEQMTVRNESIIKGIKENGGSWGGFVPDSYREKFAEIDAASWAAGGQFNVQKPLTREQAQKGIDFFLNSQYQEIQAHLRGETGDSRFINYDVNFLEHVRQMTPERFAQEVRDANISFHAGIDPRVRVQVPIPEISSVLANGYKTTHELRSDHSPRAIRLPYETSIGIHPKTPANLRPASGYIVHQDWLEAELQAASKDIEAQGLENAHPELLARGETLNIVKAGRGMVETYGGVEVILRPEVAERTQYLHGDSLITKGLPTPMTGTDITSIQKSLMYNFEAGNSLTELLYGHWSKNHAASHRHMIRDGENIPKGSYGAGPRTWKNESYMEALIAGSFDSGDIDEIVMPELDYVPYNWISDSESKPQAVRTQQTYGGQVATGRVYPPAIDHLRDEKKLIEKLGFTPKEAKIGAQIAKEKFFAESGQPGLLRRETHLFAAIAMREALEKKGIKFTVKHKKGYDVFDPKTINPDAPDGSTVTEALVFKIEEHLKRIVRAEIAEAGRKAQQQASSSEKVVV